ncbi:MAG: MBL fold metallo-hydrolase [Eubacteriales bacterium]|nr:MBL fold metallo-hydrolase [Eubacteriales bacterium]
MEQWKDAVQYYGIGGLMYLIAAAAWLYAFVKFGKKQKKVWLTYAGYVLVFVFPAGAVLLERMGESGYSALLLSVPTLIFAGAAGAHWLGAAKSRRGFWAGLAVLVLILLGTIGLDVNVYRIKGLNPYEKAFRTESGECLVVTDTDLTDRVPEKVRFSMAEGSDEEILFQALKDKADYLSFQEESTVWETALDLGFEETDRLENNVILRNTMKDREDGGNMWYITQYASLSGAQAMFYTIQDIYGHLIVIDGGHTEDAEQVREVIRELGDHVDVWFLTHPHPDHIEAFTAVYTSGDCPDIDVIYASEFDPVRYEKEAKPWDEYEVFVMWQEAVQGEERLQYLKAGDVLDIYGLTVKCLHDYSQKEGGSAANDGALMLKMIGNEQSMLFCADVEAKQEQKIIDRFGEDLPSTYIQMAHHGNDGVSEKFYRLVKPEKAFFDAPEWLMNPSEENARFTTPENRELMESMGAETVYYATAPNSVILK